MARRARNPEKNPLIDRESAWIQFNERVLEEADDPQNPLLERVRFLNIFHTNLDEFFMIRVSGIREQLAAGVQATDDHGKSPRLRLNDIREHVSHSLDRADQVTDRLLADLAAHHITQVRYDELEPSLRRRWNQWYLERVHPILTPLAVSPALPFPFISNLSLNLAASVRSPEGEERLARIKIPDHLPRYIVVDEGDLFAPPLRLLPISDLIGANLHHLFPGMEVTGSYSFRVTRDADVEIHEDEADDLLKYIEVELRKRRFGHAVRLEIEASAPRWLVADIQDGLDLDDSTTYLVHRVMDPATLSRLAQIDVPAWKFKPFVPRVHKDLSGPGIFARIAQGDILLHHPFDSFAPTAELVRQAARDPAVVAIKMTLYRTSGDSPVIQALLDAVENGKQVAAVVELKARFDEKNNIVWARRLEEAGCHVIYGVPNLKTHAKLCLVVRREEGTLRRYCHIGTGNYNPITARVYTDLGLFTCDPDLCADVADLFNQITGFARPPSFRDMLVAPRFMKDRLLQLIRYETNEARAGRQARIILKCNTVTDRALIEALYDASRAGVPVELIVRGACALAPGRKGISETIQVRSVVGRFLEHSRVYWFHHAGEHEVLIGSSDLMERNLDRRVEVLVPIRTPELAHWLRHGLLQGYLDDVARSRVMQSDGTYARLPREPDSPDVQARLLEALQA
jgi:polyphosphate kinase